MGRNKSAIDGSESRLSAGEERRALQGGGFTPPRSLTKSSKERVERGPTRIIS